MRLIVRLLLAAGAGAAVVLALAADAFPYRAVLAVTSPTSA